MAESEENLRQELRNELLSLDNKRKEIEKELMSFHEVLRSHNVEMNDSLVDEEGYPRSDIDVYAIRTARNQIITKKNDACKIMKQMEELLHKYHAIKPSHLDPKSQ